MIAPLHADRWRPDDGAVPGGAGRASVDRQPVSALETLWDEVGQPLFHQQCWCWGWDIRRPAGNLLLERGFHQERPPEAGRGSTAYRLAGNGYRLGIWGFGAHYSRPGAGSVFLGRFASLPLTSALDRPPELAWLPDDLPVMEAADDGDPRVSALFPGLLRWIARYERWVVRVAGPAHRVDAVRAWGDKTVVAADRMPAAWLHLARSVERCARER